MAGRLVVIGGGPAGMLAAGAAATQGAAVTLLERGPMLARKLRMTGKGRCNLTNTADVPAFVSAFEPNGKFLYGPFSRFFRQELIDLLAAEGVRTCTERGGRVFPASDSAVEVANALARWVAGCGVEVMLRARARGVGVRGGCVATVETEGGQIDADAVIVATGGLSYPRTGSSGDGYDICRALGHTIVAPRPSLVGLETVEGWPGEVQGLALRNVEARLLPYGESARPVARQFGEMLFTHYGLSGPIILTLSRRVGVLLGAGPPTVSLDLKPALRREQLLARFEREFRGNAHLGSYLADLMPRSLAALFHRLADIDRDTPLHRVAARDRARLADTLKDLRLRVRAMRPIKEAIVTAGGVVLPEIDPRTMMSRCVEGLFVAGELLDVDGETGGYNLQAAFTTGWVAGRAAAGFAAARRSDALPVKS